MHINSTRQYYLKISFYLLNIKYIIVIVKITTVAIVKNTNTYNNIKLNITLKVQTILICHKKPCLINFLSHLDKWYPMLLIFK